MVNLGRSLGLLASFLIVGGLAHAEDGKLSFSGYADLRYSNYTVDKDATGITRNQANAQSGFGVEDGALYLGYNKEKWSLFVDAPFRRSKTGDDANGTLAADKTNEASNSNKIIFGGDKAQVYAKYNIIEGLSFKMGQFDTIYGVELNDSKDRVFGRAGLVYDILPVTHTGAIVEYSKMGITAKVFAANSNGKGSLGDDDVGNDKTEYGAAVGWANEMLRAQAGYSTRSTNNLKTPAKHANRTFWDFTAGVTWKDLSADAGFVILSDPGKNLLTTQTDDWEKDGTGLLGLVTYKFTEDLLAGVRYETLANGPTGSNWKSAEDYGASVHYKLDSNLEARTEYVAYKYKVVTPSTTSKNWDESRFNFAVLASF